jgi:hypothetical protein
MNYRRTWFSLSLAIFLTTPHWAWAGAANGCAGIRESFLAHVCDGGSKNGQACAIDFNCGPPTSGDCPGGACVIDYTTSKVVKADVTILFDEETSTYEAPQTSLGPALTFVVCVRKKGEHCFTETYRPPAAGNPCGPTASILLGSFGCVSEAEVAAVTMSKQYLIDNWQYFVPEGLNNPDGDLANELRQLFEVTGIPVLADFSSSGGVDDHTGDNTGSAMHFTAKLRFVSGLD